MKRTLIFVLIAVTLSGRVAGAQDAKTILDAASAALGATNLRTIEFAGRGSDFIFGQAYDGSSPWPRFSLPSYTMTIDYTIPAMRDDRRRQQVENPPRGGGLQPLVGELRQIWVLSGNYAWDVAGRNAVPAAAERDIRTAVDGRLAQIWMTPQGFIKAALANHATAKTETVRGAKKTSVSFTAPNKAKFEGLLNEQNLVEMITTWLDNPVLGDIAFEAVFPRILYVIDGRAPAPRRGREWKVSSEDVFGEFDVKKGEIVPGSYRPNPQHRILSKKGFFKLEDELADCLLVALDAIPDPDDGPQGGGSWEFIN
jgi:hypothetical protein